MTATDAYHCDDVFRSLVNEWAEYRRCPRPLVDRCLDFGLDGAAECARWASTEADRPVYEGAVKRGDLSGPYPVQLQTGAFWNTDGMNECSHDVHKIGALCPFLPSCLLAILWLLDNYPAPVPA